MKSRKITPFVLGFFLIVCLSFTSSLAGDTTFIPPSDFDGDGKTDVSIYRPSSGEWWVRRSSDGAHYALTFGLGTDKIIPADYTGDGKADVAVWRPSGGEWYILRSEDYSYYAFSFGIDTDVPAPADYDGDRRVDAAVFRPSTGVWYILKSLGGLEIAAFGVDGDRPVPADYDGDGKSDLAVFRSHVWWIRRSSDGGAFALVHGSGFPLTDVAVPGDYSGDGKADAAYYATINNREWNYRRSENSTISVVHYEAGGIPAPGNYNGDHRMDRAMFYPATGHWRINYSSGGGDTFVFGASGDIPTPNAYVR